MSKPKVLLIDLETLPNICYAYDLYSAKSYKMIKQEKAIITFAYKWLGEASTIVLKAMNPYDDAELVDEIVNILNQADYVVGHYSDKFDIKFIRTRALANKVTPPAPVATIDTYKLAKKFFNFNANRLDYLGSFLKVGNKIPTSFSLWERCAEGNRKAINEMADYNRQDVILLEKVFLKLLPYCSTNLNHNLFYEGDKIVCHHCGSDKLQKRGTLVNKVTKRQRYQCKKCGSWHSVRV